VSEAALPFEPPDETGRATARHGLRVARAALGQDEPCPDSCTICNSGWTYSDRAIGNCSVCGEPCRSRDPQGVMRHPMCEAAA